jgi:WD40 repeat protein
VLLWRGEVLADFERWMRQTTGAVVLGDLETSFIAASRRVARRARWTRRLLVAAGVVGLLAGGEYRAAWKTRTTEQIAEVEQGRHALLDDDFPEAQLHLTEAYRLGDHSPALTFMLSRALQPLIAEQARLAAAFGRMWSAVFSPDAQRIVTSDDRSARVWDARTNQLLFTLPHGDTVYDARYSADGTRIVTAGGDGTVRIWDAASGAVVHVLKRETPNLKPPRWYLVVISPDNRFIAAIDLMGEVAHVWDAGTGASVADLHNDASEYPSLAFSSDGRWLATSGGDDVRVFDTRTWAQVLTIAGPRVRSLGFDPTGRLATGSARGDASIWEIPSGTQALHLREIGEPIDAMAFSPDGTLVVTASRDGAEQIWDAKSGVLHSQFNALRSKILSVEFDRTSKLVVAAGVSGTVIVADAALGMPVSVLSGPGVIIRTAHFDPTSRRIVGASWGEMAWVWDATPPYRRWSSSPISDDCGLGTSLEPDRRFLAIGCRDRNTRIWDTAHDKLLAELPSVTPVEGDFASAFPAVDADGDRAAIARGHTVEVYELPSCRLLRVIRHGAAVNAVAFAPSGHDLVSGATDGSLLVTRDDREPIVLPPSSGGIDAAGFLADGRIVAADAFRHLRVYDPEHNAVLAELEVSIRVRTLRASPDSRRLLTVPSYLGEAARPLLWDLDRYRLVAPLDGHVGQIYGARFVAGGREIITAGGDGAARLWDGATGQPRATFRGGSRFLVDAVVSPDGSMVIAGGGDGLLRFWDATSGRQLWKLQAHNSNVIGIHFEGDDLVTRGFGGDVSRWRLPTPERVVEACKVATTASPGCAIVAR